MADELFQNEYALAYFNSMDFGQLFTWTEGGGDAGDVFKLENQELEYIVYGFHNPSSIVAAYARDIWDAAGYSDGRRVNWSTASLGTHFWYYRRQFYMGLQMPSRIW